MLGGLALSHTTAVVHAIRSIVFDPSGRVTAGPPVEKGQSLPSFPLEMDGEAVFALIEEV